METKYETDVVVVGAGLAGLVTALELLENGRRVVILERTPREELGGQAPHSFGGVFFVDSPEQRRTGIHDSVPLALQDWFAYGELEPNDVWPRKWAEAYVARCLEDVRGYLVDRGVSFVAGVNWTERGYYVPGNSVPRFHVAWGTGKGIVDAITSRLLPHTYGGRLQLRFDHTVESFVIERARFVGVRGRTKAGEEFEARGDAIVIAAGGIAGNLEKVRQHWPASLGTPPEVLLNGALPDSDGALLDTAESHGARMTHLDKMWNYAAGVRHWRPKFPLHGLSLVPGKSALWVNYRGKRFEDPPLVGSYDTLMLVDRICREPKKYSWQVMNWNILRKELAVSGAEFNPDVRDKQYVDFAKRMVMGADEMARDFIENCPDFVTANSVPELVDRMNAVTGTNDVDGEVLARDIANYDANIERGPLLQNDDQIRRILHTRRYIGDRIRTCALAKIDDPTARPLVAIRLSILTRKSLGGLLTDLHGRVIDKNDKPMEGLYAVGESAGFGGGGVHGKRALEGTFLGSCIFTGRVAAQSIVRGHGADGRT